MSPRLGCDIAAYRGKVDLPLVTKSVVETLPADLQRAYKHLRRSTLEPMLPEHVDRRVQRLFLNKRLWSRHTRNVTLLWNDQSRTREPQTDNPVEEHALDASINVFRVHTFHFLRPARL